eukprot:TRINITY_DN7789_c0_g1_i1.p1 TRINITY_DN7789_c0_g1~~TRINITY_DN7789_c0_g1_i1.p1  ORF type:complete len:140 (+),score=24.66 TRINITY_DN7789_c0_g1_i1:78-497(+)
MVGVGITNRENICYLNSLLQALFHLESADSLFPLFFSRHYYHRQQLQELGQHELLPASSCVLCFFAKIRERYHESTKENSWFYSPLLPSPSLLRDSLNSFFSYLPSPRYESEIMEDVSETLDNFLFAIHFCSLYARTLR